jgi:competence protein ComEA
MSLPERLRELARVSPAEVALAAVLAAVVVAGSFVVSRRAPQPPAPPLRLERAAVPTASPAPPPVLVHVTGHVVRPGIYPLPAGSRVNDALAAAGGPAPGGEPHALNLAAPVADGEQVVVPPAGTAPVPRAPGGSGPAAGTTVDLNIATQAQLEQLPGIGPKLAQRILAHRQRKGRFSSPRDLLQIEGFGPRKLAGLEDLVTAG